MNYEALALWSQVISSILFAVAIVMIFMKYIAPAVNAVQISRNEEIAAAERRRDAAKAELTRIRAEHAAYEASVKAMRERARLDANREHDRLVVESRAEGERVIRNADGELDRVRADSRRAFEAKLIERALDRARERALKEVTTGVDQAVTEQFLQRVDQKTGRVALASQA